MEEELKEIKEFLQLVFLDFEELYGFNVDIIFNFQQISKKRFFNLRREGFPIVYKNNPILPILIQVRSIDTFNRKVAERRKIISEFNINLKEAIDKFNILSDYKIKDYPNTKLDYSGNIDIVSNLEEYQLYSDFILKIDLSQIFTKN